MILRVFSNLADLRNPNSAEDRSFLGMGHLETQISELRMQTPN